MTKERRKRKILNRQERKRVGEGEQNLSKVKIYKTTKILKS